MKRLFFQLVISVMISSCHDANLQHKIENATIIEQQTNDCLKDNATNNLHQLGNITVQACPVN
ncbi:hypothetical protein A9G34_07760 [Gilliamella sp. Choc4-2]|nr:hypothetical protein GAPWKB11_0712 [Gilliamella apicola]OCG31861.1 hypothetical protein A9G33_04835 [Gilliamella apicola]OCG43875.1 hypothetical protein A9G34_07760 [Gilliamella apicola]OCG54952.1 hypothetical protein A9G36_07135 [Gilliamella apicola]OCG64901.1 hypothetical protein A9G48_01345 [Gilliamella apicola]